MARRGPRKEPGGEQGIPFPVLGLVLVGTQEQMSTRRVTDESEIWRKGLGNETENVSGLE